MAAFLLEPRHPRLRAQVLCYVRAALPTAETHLLEVVRGAEGMQPLGGAIGAHPGDLVLQNPRTSHQVERDG